MIATNYNDDVDDVAMIMIVMTTTIRKRIWI